MHQTGADSSLRSAGFVLSTKLEGDYFFSRSDAEKTNKAAIKAKKKAEKEEAKAAAKAAKAKAKKGGDDGGGAAEAPKGRLTPAQKLQAQADGVHKLSKQASQLGAHAASNSKDRGDATVQCVQRERAGPNDSRSSMWATRALSAEMLRLETVLPTSACFLMKTLFLRAFVALLQAMGARLRWD